MAVNKKRNRFDDLEQEFLDGLVTMDSPTIDQKIAGWAKLIEATLEAMKQDDDLAGKRETARLASAPYYQDIKMAKLRISYAISILTDRGAH
jgi:hypothetical protein